MPCATESPAFESQPDASNLEEINPVSALTLACSPEASWLCLAMLLKDRIIVALDTPSIEATIPFIRQLSPYVSCFKIGLELMTSVGAPAAVREIHELGGFIFFDGKFNDIPNTIAGASRAVAALKVKMFDVHAASGVEGMRAAVANKGKSQVIAVTVLTSIDETGCQHVFGDSTQKKVLQFAHDALSAGMDGIVCSPQELRWLGQDTALKSLIRLTPGVRPAWAGKGDQKRVLTPKEAIELGATCLVIGRPITQPPPEIGSPVDAVKKIWDEIAEVAK